MKRLWTLVHCQQDDFCSKTIDLEKASFNLTDTKIIKIINFSTKIEIGYSFLW